MTHDMNDKRLTQGETAFRKSAVRKERTLGPQGANSWSVRYGLRALRYVVFLMMMVVGVNGTWGATITYHIINLGRLDDNGALTSTRTEALQFTTTETTVGVPDKYKSPLAKNWQYYSSSDVTYNSSTKMCVFNSGPSLSVGDALSDGAHVYVTYELDKDKFREIGIYNRGIYKIKFPDNYYLKQTYWDDGGKIPKEINTGSATNPTTSEFLWKFNVIDPYQITVQSQSQSSDNCFNYYLCSKLKNGVGNFGDIRLNATISGAKTTDVWVFGLLNGGASGTYRLVVTDGFINSPTNDNKLDSFGHGYLNNKRSGRKTTYQLYNQSNYDQCDLSFVPVTKNYIIVNNSGEPLVQALSDDNTLDVPGEIKSPLASYTYYGTQQDAINEGTQLNSATGATIYVRYTTRDDVLNLKGEIKYNISVGGTNYLYAADETTLSSEATSDNNANNNHKWTLTGNDAYQITIKNVDNSKEITYDVSSGEAVPTLSGAGNKFFLHQSTSGQYEVVAITANDYSTPDYYTLGLDAGNLNLYSCSSHAFGDTEVQTVITPRATAAITTPPTANSLTYNGSNQNLVTSGTASNGTIKYCLGVPGSYVDAVPTAKDADTYNVYYMAAGDDGYEDFVAAEPIEVTLNKQSITVSGITTSNKTYDGNTMATLVYTGATLTGDFDGENLTISAIGTFDNKNVGTDKEVTISDLTLGGSVADNYELAPSGQQTYTTADITAKDITVSGIAASNKTYDGTTTAVFDYTAVTLTGKVIGDDLSVTATGTYDTKDVGTGKTVTISSLTLSGDDKDNYVLVGSGQQESTTANITPATLTVTADNKTVEYGSPAPEYTVTITGFVNNETLSVLTTIPTATCEYTTTSPKGSYDIVPSGGEADNYSFTYVNGTLTVAAAFVTLIANSETVTYDGTEKTVTGFTCSVDGLTFTGVSASGSGTAVGTYPVTFTGVTENTTTDSSGDYVVTSIVEGTLTINPAEATVTADNKTKTYGETDPTLTATVSGLYGSDAIAYTLNRATGNNVGDYVITPTGDAAQGNYTVSFVPGTFTISQKDLTITAADCSITYGEAPSNAVTYSGFITGESENTEGVFTGTLVYSYNSQEDGQGTSYTTTIPAGTSYIIPSGLTATNYAITFVPGTLTVEQKSIGDGTNPALGITIDIVKNGNDTYTTTVKQNGTNTPLVEGTSGTNYDYSITPTGNASSKYYEVTITGANNYTGSAKAKFANITLSKVPGIGDGGAATFVTNSSGDADYATPANMTTYVITGINASAGTVTVEPLDYIPENVPVLLVSTVDTNGFQVMARSGGTNITNTQKDENLLTKATGDYAARTFATAEIYLLYMGEFVLNAAGTLPEGKVYLSKPSGASPVKLYIDWDLIDGIDEHWTMDDENSRLSTLDSQLPKWYTLDGRCLGGKPTKRGLYLHDGQKIVISGK